MQASVDSQIVHIHGIKNSLTSEKTGSLEYQQENSNQRNRGGLSIAVYLQHLTRENKQNERSFLMIH